MYRATAFLLFVGCGFDIKGSGGPGAADARITPMPDAMIDARMIDAQMIDAQTDSATTNHAVLADTFLASDAPTGNFSTQTSALADGNIVRNALFRFDLSGIPMTATISAAELHIWTDSDAGNACTIYRVLESWDEATTTWNKRNAFSNWIGAGAGVPSRGTTAIGTVVPSVANMEYVIPIDLATVTAWVAASASNNGLVITTTESNGTRFSTKENANAAVHPYLRVTHTP